MKRHAARKAQLIGAIDPNGIPPGIVWEELPKQAQDRYEEGARKDDSWDSGPPYLENEE